MTDEFWRTSQLSGGEGEAGLEGHTFDTFKISVDENGHESCISIGGQEVGAEESCSPAEVEQQRDLSLFERMLGGKN